MIDGGVDTSHVDLRANLWSNPAGVAGNDGFPGGLRGWDFIGGAHGDVRYDTYELTRVYVRCTLGDSAAGAGTPTVEPRECARATQEFARKRGEAAQTLARVQQISTMVSAMVPVLTKAVGSDSLTVEKVTALKPASPEVQQARTMYLRMASQGMTPAVLAQAVKAYGSQTQYGLNPEYNPRGIVGDNYADLSQRRYGNPDVTGPDALHGTHVAGIIGAVRGNGVGMDGIAPAVRIMSIRAVPDGDERDKDIANAIRFAVDHGANVINMSFGKGYSPGKRAVDDAVRYADVHGVLMVHAAGNDGADLAQSQNFPTPVYLGGGRAQNWIEVGASSWRGLDSLATPFSNYNQTLVDVFAPGEDIYSTLPGNTYGRESGTSMAAPVVSGLAALIMSYYPSLSAADVKRIILTSATPYKDQQVVKPGAGGERVPFGSLSATGAIVNAYAALRMAAQAGAIALPPRSPRPPSSP